MSWRGDFLRLTFQGELAKTFPQYPTWVALCSGLGMPNTFTTRLPAALSVLLTALVCGVFVARRQGRLGGVVAGSMVLSSMACLRIGQRAQGETLLMLWLTCAWLSWYAFGQERKRWGYAWSSALLFVFLASMTVGARAVLYFYLPFLFLKLPVRGRRRLLQPYHMVAFAVFGGALYLWLRAAPGQPFMPWNAEHARDAHSGSFLWDRLFFLAKVAAYLMPWTAMAWAPFCVAFRPVERVPVLFHYLRTQLVTLFLLVWLIPWSSPRALLPVLPSLAILTGCHFDILMRRHREPLERYLTVMGWLGLVLSCLGLLCGVLHVFGVLAIVGLSLRVVVWSAGIFAIAALMATLALRAKRRGDCTYWLRFMVAVCAVRLVVAAVHPTLEAWGGNERWQVAMVLTGKRPASELHGGEGPTLGGVKAEVPGPNLAPAEPTDAETETAPPAQAPAVPRPWGLPDDVDTVYVSQPPLIIESFYMGRLTLAAEDLERDLPADAPVVYVLGGGERPILSSRIWTPVSPVLDSRRRNGYAWSWLPDSWCLFEVRVVPRETSDGYKANPIRLYRGVLR
jgi:4-amino-4-deoxy-L-arabinose transferase-like glycosyltransferase